MRGAALIQFDSLHVEALVDANRRLQCQAGRGTSRDRSTLDSGASDVLVNNVRHHLGIFNQLTNSTEEQWQQLYDINLRLFIVNRAMIPLMRRSETAAASSTCRRSRAFAVTALNVVYGTFNTP